MASQCNTRTQMGQMSRTQLERIASGDLDNMPIATAFAIEEEDNVQLAAAVADNRSRGQHAIVIQRNAPLTPTWIGERWSGTTLMESLNGDGRTLPDMDQVSTRGETRMEPLGGP
jgi:hypothetical protein